MQQAIYIGSGLDIIPVLVFTDIKKFIYVDSRPFSEHGTQVYTKEYTSYTATLETREIHEKNNLFSRHTFLDEIKELMKQNNFTLQFESKYCIIYKNEYDQIIKYHLSCAFPEFLTDEIKNDIFESDTLILCGYFPNILLLSMMKNLKYIIGDTHTCYTYDAEDINENTVIKTILDNPQIVEKYFLLKEIQEYEYWEHSNIIPSIRDNYKVLEFNDIKELYKFKS